MSAYLRNLAARVIAIRVLLEVLSVQSEQYKLSGDEPAWRDVREQIVNYNQELQQAESELLEAVLVAADPDQPVPFAVTDKGRQAVGR